MTIFRRMGYFLITNLLVMISISIIMMVVNTVLYGTPNPPENNYLTYMIIWSAVWGMGGAFISLWMSKSMAIRSMRVKIIDPKTSNAEERRIVDSVHRMARQAELPKMPEVGIYHSEEVNAFATGPSKKNSLVAVSTGLLNKMNRAEVDGVLGHEVAHIANGDMVTMTLVQGVVNAFVLFFARIIANIVSDALTDSRNGSFAIYIAINLALQLVFGVLGMVVVGYFSRLREFRADKGGAEYAGRGNMLAALRALQMQTAAAAAGPRPTANNAQKGKDPYASLKISNLQKGGILSLLSTHPPLDKRINSLQTMSQ